jgi:PAS domain S-box-containing protein
MTILRSPFPLFNDGINWLGATRQRAALAGLAVMTAYSAFGMVFTPNQNWPFGVPFVLLLSLLVPGFAFLYASTAAATMIAVLIWANAGHFANIIVANHPLVLPGIVWVVFAVIWYSRTIVNRAERAARHSRDLDDSRLNALVKMNAMSSADMRDVMNFALEEGIRLTQSELGYLAFLNEDESILKIHSWSKSAMDVCMIQDKPMVFPIENTGLWGEAVRQRKAVITNDYASANPLKKGCPQGHVRIDRHMNIPVFDGDKIVAVAGVGNKDKPYDESDVRQLTLLMGGMWRHMVRARLVGELQQQRQELEAQVELRTDELGQINQSLQSDIENRLLVEDALRESETKYRTLFNSSGEAIMLLDGKGFFDCNPATLAMFHCETREEFCSKHPADLSPPFQPCGTDSITLANQHIARAVSQGSYRFEWMHARAASGEPFPAEVLLTAIELDGKPVIQATVTDITERTRTSEELRASEERYRGLVDNLGIGVAVISPAMQVLAMNRRMTEWNPTVDVETQPICYRSFNNPPRAEICGYCPTCLTLQDGEVHEATTKTPIDEIEFKHFRVVASPLRNKAGEIVAAIEMVEDVTERVRIEENQQNYLNDVEQLWLEQTRLSSKLSSSIDDLAQSKHETEEALSKLTQAQASMVQSEKMASIGVLAAGIAHEINNPIGYVSSNLRELIKYTTKISDYMSVVRQLEDAVSARDIPAAERIRDELNQQRKKLRLGFILGDLEKITRESLAGTSTVETIVKALKQYAHPDNQMPIPLNLAEILDNSVRIVWNQIKETASIVREYADDLPTIYGFAGSLQQVFSNLIINAAQAIPHKGQITLRLRREDAHVVAEVADNGGGIKPEHLSHIFEPFFTTKDVGQGTGLGLSLVYDIIKKNSGSIDVESEVGKGTVFTMRFPITQPKADTAPEVQR